MLGGQGDEKETAKAMEGEGLVSLGQERKVLAKQGRVSWAKAMERSCKRRSRTEPGIGQCGDHLTKPSLSGSKGVFRQNEKPGSGGRCTHFGVLV